MAVNKLNAILNAMSLRINRQSVPIRFLPTLILLFSIIVSAVIIILPVKQAETLVSANIDKCLGTTDFSCYSNYYASITKTTTPVKALEDLRILGDKNSYAKNQCHQLAHVIGHEGYAKYGSLAKAYTMGDSYCWSGYYHGVTESAVGALGADKIRAETNNICSELATKQKYSFDHFNCVHGLGHGFMTVDNFKLFEALKSCDLLHDEWDKTSCYGGVFMENVMVAVRGDGSSEYLKPGEPMYPCTAVDTIYKQQCYLMQTSYALQQNSYDFGIVSGLCASLHDRDFIATCYQSLGRDASGSTNSDIAQTKTNCQSAIDYDGLKNCVLGAVRDIVSYYHDDAQAKLFCGQFEAPLNDVCVQEVSTYYQTFTPRES